MSTCYRHFCDVNFFRRYSVHAHAAAALINFCEGVEHGILIPYLDPIVERLLKMLNASSEKCYCQEQAITSLAMVADASEAAFQKHYTSIMPLLLGVLQNAHGKDHSKLRVKAMECAGLVGVFGSHLAHFFDILIA